MKSNYKRLGEYIRQIDVRNKDDDRYDLLGVSVEKCFISSIANTVGTDWHNYKIIKKGQFCYIPDTSRRGDKIGIAHLTDREIGLVSAVYTVFEVWKEELVPEYLMLWFKRPEFDRYARFHSHGSVREIFDWEEMCNVELPIPAIEEQKAIVNAYETIERRIALKRKINDNLAAQAYAIYQDWFIDNGEAHGAIECVLADLINILDYKRIPLSSQERAKRAKVYRYFGAAGLLDYVDAFVVISDGVNNKYGSLFADYDYFYSWNKIGDEETLAEGINSLYSMVKGMFRKDRLLAIVKDFIFFPDTSKNNLKIVCRYPQFFAATKLLESIKEHMRPAGDGKGGTYFGATGCGKSYTMLFLTRMIMRSVCFKSPTILLITDRTDLDNQLSKIFVNAKKYIGDAEVISILSREDLGEKLRDKPSGGVYLTTIQKFTEDLSLLSDRSNIICISDEAHRSQVNLEQKVRITEQGVERHYGFARYLHDSLPNATYVGFTGTPIDATIDVFGTVVDRYTMTESVKDGITVNLVYEGRAAKVTLDKDKLEEIEEYYQQCEDDGANPNQIEASKKAIAHLDIILGDPERLKAIAQDFVTHYEKRVNEGATVCGKALFVVSNRKIAYSLYKLIREIRPEWFEIKVNPDEQLSEKEKKEILPMAKVNLVMTRAKDDEKELWDLLGNDEYKKELDRQFKKAKSNFKIAIVVDMWLTGFDVPELDTMYLDKPVQQHTLIQTISRVNRVCKGKDKGLIVDYIGIKYSMNKALKQYTDFKENDLEEIGKSVIIVRDMLEVLNGMFNRFNKKPYFEGTPKEQLDCLNHAVEYVQTTKDLEDRFMAVVKRMKEAYNLCSGGDELTDAERDLIHFYMAVRAVLYKLTKPNAPDAEQMNNQTINEMELPKHSKVKKAQDDNTVEHWVRELAIEAQFNIPSYTECFISENLLRKYIVYTQLPLSEEALKEANRLKAREHESKEAANISYSVRQSDDNIFYLDMNYLANLIDKVPNSSSKIAGLSRSATIYKPLRDSVGHTSLLTDNAKAQLTLEYNNIQARLVRLLTSLQETKTEK